ncbi:Actin-binding protein anillin [Armadillidium nasatum]|uniref:Actin-binding protein anillin n=1 Tax=Armadillidium nasatum TaxID=96803 RepID=A0A5N5SJF5_9CRUS|nr:Actin-binding protein anillin [Armadillidium nasatum]
MTDPFIQRMKERNRARRNVLSLISEDSSNKENDSVTQNNSELRTKRFQSPDIDKNSDSISGKEDYHGSENPTLTSHSLSSTSHSTKSTSDSVLKVSSNINSNRSPRFQHLAQRTKQLQEWEDDYTYHSVCNSSVKEVECTDLGLHDSIQLDYSNTKHEYDTIDGAILSKLSDIKSLKSKSLVDEFQTPSKTETSCYDSSKNEKNNSSNYCSPQSQANYSPFHSVNSNFSSQSSPCPVNTYLPANDSKNTPPSIKKVVSSSASVTPTRRLAWDKQLLKSLEAQGYTPSPSRSKLGYDFRDRSPIKEPVVSSSSTTEKVPSNINIQNIPPKIVSFQSKGDTQAKETTHISSTTPKKRDLSPSKVGDLRNQWEQHIRNASPDRQDRKSRSPSPVRKFVSRSRSPIKSSTNLSCQTGIQSPKSISYSTHNQNDSSRVLHYQSSSHISRTPNEVIKGETPMPDAVPVVKNQTSSVKEKAAAFSSLYEPRAPEKDPAELSVRDRLNLFEKKKGPVLIPKAPFGQCISEKVRNTDNSKSVISQTSKSESNPSVSSSQKDGNNEGKENSCSSSLVGSQKMLFEKFEDNWKEADINVKIKTEKEKDLQMLQNRFRRVPPSYSSRGKCAPPTKAESSDSEYPESEESAFDSDVMLSNECTVPVGPPKPPRTGLYAESSPEFARPLLPGSSRSPYKRLNSTEIDDDSYPRSPRKDFAESVLTCASGESLGAKIQKMAQGTGNSLATRQLSVIAENAERKLSSSFQSTSSSTLDGLEDVEDAIDEALNEEYESPSSKRVRNAKEDDEGHNSVYKTPKICKNSENPSNSPENSLAHTISMYRKQKPAEVMVTPVRQIVRKPDINSPPKDSPISPSVTISTRIRELQDEASSAISVVSQHLEQHGTMQHIEAEKLLLVATQKRQCALHEIQRLKAEGALGKRNCWNLDDDSCRGSISINNISLPLKTDFLNKLNERSVHHFVVLVKHREQVITSQLQATPDCIVQGAITFPNLMALHNLTADFNISLEVYAFKVEPFLIGFANLNINTLTRNAWTLEKVPFSSPVNGHLLMHVNVTMEGGVRENSFLNMFEDVGGFGAWNRRWCVLRGPFIKYWSYPDEELSKECIGKLDLRTCTTRRVELVSRDICARQHTFQLTFMRPLKAGDKADLVHDIKNNTLISRILLSADSKEERILWCNKLNKALANVRSWDPDALKPEDFQV